MKISAVINTLNEENNIEKCLKTLDWVDEIVVCDDGSSDKTLEIAKKYNAKIVKHQSKGYVEPARNFAISKATGDWILIVDADEEIPAALAVRLKKLATSNQQPTTSHVLIPRKNHIFGKWIKHTGWWPDYQIRFFKNGKVTWTEKIHQDPKVEGKGLKLPPDEKFAIFHHNYQTIGQYLERINRYTNIEAKELLADGYQFTWQDLMSKPFSEFLNRFFAQQGYMDGLHGLSLSMLQSFSFLITYLKVWELSNFAKQELDLGNLNILLEEKKQELEYWQNKDDKKNKIEKILKKIFK